MSDASEPTRDDLYEQAQEEDVEGRSSMTKDELAEAVGDESTTTSASMVADNGPGGGVKLSTDPKVKEPAEQTDIEKRAAETAEANKLGAVTPAGYSAEPIHPSEAGQKPLQRRR